MTALGTTFLLGANEVNAQTQRFRATPLVRIGFGPQVSGHGTAGINNKGEVVYGRNVGTFPPDLRPWIWLPEPAYNLSAGVHDLNSNDGEGIAREINESGDVVGQIGAVGLHVGNGALWQLGISGTPTTIGNFGGTNPWSSAHSISDHSTPRITGDASALRNCTCAGSIPDQPVVRGFHLEIGEQLIELLPTPETFAYGRDIVKADSSNAYFIAGITHCAFGDDLGLGCVLSTSVPCQSTRQPKFWNNTATFPSTLDKLSVSRDAEAYGVNKWSESVGWSYNTASPCVRRAVYWSSPSASVEELPMPTGQTNDPGRAAAINDLANPQVVGWNEFNDHALLWEFSGSSWSALDLQSTTSIGSLGGGNPAKFDLKQAHDINDNGWIITWGYINYGAGEPPAGVYAVLLTPFGPLPPTCAADVVVDGYVGVPDLLAIIANWGPCTPGNFCILDISGDFQVGVADLLAVIANWGPCGQPSEGAPESIEDCHQACASQFGVGTSAYAECMDACIRALCESGKLPPEECE